MSKQRGSHHLYVHVPFCRLVCAYCDFVTVGGRATDMPRYVEALLAELEMRAAPVAPSTIYLGGGTPSLLPAGDIARILRAARRAAGGSSGQPDEVTLEANPSEREAPDWDALRRAGVDRISLGVQSLSDAQLRTLARGHTAGEAREAFRRCRVAGFANVSIDLIYGIPGQSLEHWRRDMAAAIDLGPDHLSLYALQLALTPDEWAAPPRAGALRWRARLAGRQDDGLASTQYALAEEMLAAAGFVHYEISSWARPGRESRHNAGYWARRPYTGIGAGAHSYDGAAVRSWNERDLDRYLAAIESGVPAQSGREELDEPTRAFEAVALGLRSVAGIRRGHFAAEFGTDPVQRFTDGVALGEGRGLLQHDAERVWLTRSGRLLANEVLLEFLPPPVR